MVLSEEEKAYRRGFDQGVAFVLMDIGLTNKQVQDLQYKRRLGLWRHARSIYRNIKRDPAPRMWASETAELREVLDDYLEEYFKDKTE